MVGEWEVENCASQKLSTWSQISGMMSHKVLFCKFLSDSLVFVSVLDFQTLIITPFKLTKIMITEGNTDGLAFHSIFLSVPVFFLIGTHPSFFRMKSLVNISTLLG